MKLARIISLIMQKEGASCTNLESEKTPLYAIVASKMRAKKPLIMIIQSQ